MYQNIAYDRETFTIHLWDDKKGYTSIPYRRYGYKKSKKGKFHTIFGDRVEKTLRPTKEDIAAGEVFEVDVNPDIRTLIDLYHESDDVSVNHKTMIFDIETSIENGFPNSENPTNEVTAITLYMVEDDQYYTLILDKLNKISKISSGKRQLYGFQNEYDLLGAFMYLYTEIQPTILTGWNIEFFDIPYLYARMRVVLGPAISKMLSPVGRITFDEIGKRYKIFGVSCLDYLALYKKYAYAEQSSYRLDAISMKELGKGKIQYEGSLDSLYERDLEKYIEYNINDVELVKELNEKLQYIDLVQTICHACHVPYEDIFLTTRCLEGALLTYTKLNGLVAPNKPIRDDSEPKKSISGAYVKDPKAAGTLGRHTWIFDCDATSLYPSVLMTLNISPETKIGKVLDWKASDYIENKARKYSFKKRSGATVSLSSDELQSMIKTNNYSVAANGVVYNMESVGLIPTILNIWFDQRVKYRKMARKYGEEGNKELYAHYDKRQLVQKILLNSMYGALGQAGFRFFDPDNAEAVTTTGVQVIKSAAAAGNEYYQHLLNPYDIEIELETGQIVTIDSSTMIKINRNGVDMIINAMFLKNDDIYIDK